MKLIFTQIIAVAIVLLLTTQLARSDGPEFTSNVRVSKEKPLYILQDTTILQTRWDLENNWVCAECFSMWYSSFLGFQGRPFIIETGASTNLLYLDSSDRIGINTNAPEHTVDVIGDRIKLHHNSSLSARTLHLQVDDFLNDTATIRSANAHLTLGTDPGRNIIMKPTSGSSPMGGNVGIGTFDPQAKLDVRDQIRAFFEGDNTAGDGLSQTVTLSANNNAAGKSSDVGFTLKNERHNFQWNFRTFEGSQGFVATKQGTGGPEMEIRNDTNDFQSVSIVMGNGAQLTPFGVWQDASSREYKESIEPITLDEAMDALIQLNPVKYRFKRDPDKELTLGFIAEDVPELVAAKGRKNLSSMEVVATLTKVVQNQQKVILDLSAKLAELDKIVKSNAMVAMQ